MLTLFACSLAMAAPLAAPWVVRESPAPVRAVQVNERGEELVVYRTPADDVVLELHTVPGFSGLARTSCPTFQIDDREPLHHFTLDEGCTLDSGRATFRLGTIRDGQLVSLAAHRLMNGGEVDFRFVTEDGSYHESTFALTSSKRALRAALGSETRVDPE